MGWMWALLAIVVVLAVVGLLVVRARSNGGPDGPPDVHEPPPEQAPGLFDTATPVDPTAAAAGAHTPSPDAGPDRELRDGGGDDRPGTLDDPPPVPQQRSAEEPVPVIPEQQHAPADEIEPAGQQVPADEDEPSGRHALADDVEPEPLPEPVLPEQAGPPEPLVPSRSGPPSTGGSALAALDSRLIGPAAASAPLPEGVRPGPYLGSVLAPEDGSEPPTSHRVKVHSGSRRFHTTDSPYYVRTRADLYFESESGARAAGFIAWHERPGGR